MPVDTTHPMYDERACDWQLVRDCIEGKKALVARGEDYLPRLAEQDDDAYEAYATRAKFFNATARTLVSMLGILFRKSATIVTTIPEETQWDVDMANTPLEQYAFRVAKETASVGRAGTLIDWSEQEGRPYVAFYRAEDIINWQTNRVDGRTVLTMLVLRECIQEDSADPFCPNDIEQYRVLRLDWSGETPAVFAEVYRSKEIKVRGKDKTEYLISESYELKRRGQPLPEIPFVFHNSEEAGPCPNKPPLYDIADLNIGHWRNSADLENGRHVCGVPTPYACGFGTEGKLYLGSAFAWTSEDVNAKAGFIEFSGQGLDALVKGLEETTQQMEALGARMITPRASDPEAYGTVALRNAAENSAITMIADELGDSMTRVIGWLEWWVGTMATLAETTAEYHIHPDFNAAPLTPEEMNSLTALWQQNAISYESLFTRLQRGEVIPDGVTMDEEKAKIEANPPMPAPVAAPGGPGANEDEEEQPEE